MSNFPELPPDQIKTYESSVQLNLTVTWWNRKIFLLQPNNLSFFCFFFFFPICFSFVAYLIFHKSGHWRTGREFMEKSCSCIAKTWIKQQKSKLCCNEYLTSKYRFTGNNKRIWHIIISLSNLHKIFKISKTEKINYFLFMLILHVTH